MSSMSLYGVFLNFGHSLKGFVFGIFRYGSSLLVEDWCAGRSKKMGLNNKNIFKNDYFLIKDDFSFYQNGLN